ncbi:MAG: hypothetical protein RML75_08920 [Cyanobacteriota bacterium SKYGB_h_bin112]|nr:hypothetical protein [Cyanobacteriota bacterium SKYGB_h_bin112]
MGTNVRQHVAMRLLVEGWRSLPHSYAVINQFQSMELLKHPEITNFHLD